MHTVREAGRRGVYLYLDRRIFTKTNDMSNLNAFLAAAPPNAAVEYIRAVTSYGADNSRSLPKASCTVLGASRGKGGGRVMRRAGPVTYQTGMGQLEQAAHMRGDRRLDDAHEAAAAARDQGYESAGGAADLAASREAPSWADSEEGEEVEEEQQHTEPGAAVRKRYRMRVKYDGTNYNGWQLQHHQPSVQGLLETVISIKLQQPIRLVGAGRTDAGVHARGQAIHFDLLNATVAPDRIEATLHQLNNILPSDVRVYNLELAPAATFVDALQQERPWHAMLGAKGKHYAYRLHAGAVADPLQRLTRFHEHRKLDIPLLFRAAACFEGTHDFSAFSNNPRDKVKQLLLAGEGKKVRTIRAVRVLDEGDGNLRLDFFLDGALYKMVRNIVGAILAVSSGKLALGDLQRLLNGSLKRGELRSPWNAAPAHGLCLEHVFYDDY